MCLTFIYNTLLYNPLLKLYRSGPMIKGLGFWGGMSDSELCSFVTHHSQSFWEQNKAECIKIVRRKENSFIVFVESSLQIYMTYLLLLFIASNMAFIRNIYYVSFNTLNPTGVLGKPSVYLLSSTQVGD